VVSGISIYIASCEEETIRSEVLKISTVIDKISLLFFRRYLVYIGQKIRHLNRKIGLKNKDTFRCSYLETRLLEKKLLEQKLLEQKLLEQKLLKQKLSEQKLLEQNFRSAAFNIVNIVYFLIKQTPFMRWSIVLSLPL